MKNMLRFLACIALTALSGFPLAAAGAADAGTSGATRVTVNWIPGGPLHGHDAEIFLLNDDGNEIAVGIIAGAAKGPSRNFTLTDPQTGQPLSITGDYHVRFIIGPETRASADTITITPKTSIPLSSLPISREQ